MVNPRRRTLHECRTYHEERGGAKRRCRCLTHEPASVDQHPGGTSDHRYFPHSLSDLVHARGHNLGHDWSLLGRLLAPDDRPRFILDPGPFGHSALWSTGGPYFRFLSTFHDIRTFSGGVAAKSGKRKDMGLSRTAWSLHCCLGWIRHDHIRSLRQLVA